MVRSSSKSFVFASRPWSRLGPYTRLFVIASLFCIGSWRAAILAAEPPSVFELPKIQAQYVQLQQKTLQQFKDQDYAGAEKTCRDAITLWPYEATAHYNLACALAHQDHPDAALAALEQSILRGFNQAGAMQEDPDLVTLRELPRFKELVETASTARVDPALAWKHVTKPSAPTNGVALVDASNTDWVPVAQRFQTRFDFSQPAGDIPGKPIVIRQGAAGDLVRKWFEEGTAAGNWGDLYDNRDADHSNMHFADFRTLSRIEYSDIAKQQNLHYGLQLLFQFNRPTIGNSSTALTGKVIWRSQPRLAITQPGGIQQQALQYFSNHIYMYPEHTDHDPSGSDGKGFGDVFPMNTPYCVISQGSSGSDVVFLDAFVLTLAALRPDVKEQLVKRSAIAPVLQQIFRKSNRQVARPEDYFRGLAHPTVFDGTQVNAEAMVRAAHDLTMESIPPVVTIRVIEEDRAEPGVDFCDAAKSEALADTPCAIGRIAKSLKQERRMVVAAETLTFHSRKPDAETPNLKYRWVVLRGDPNRISIKPLNEREDRAEIKIKHHTRMPIAPGAALESSRVDIGVFVSSDNHDSPRRSSPSTTWTMKNVSMTLKVGFSSPITTRPDDAIVIQIRCCNHVSRGETSFAIAVTVI